MKRMMDEKILKQKPKEDCERDKSETKYYTEISKESQNFEEKQSKDKIKKCLFPKFRKFE